MYILQQKIQSDETVKIEKKLAAQINFYTKKSFAKLNVSAQGTDFAEKISGSFCHYYYGFLTPSETFSFALTPENQKLKLRYTQKISFRAKKYSGSVSAGATSYILNDEFEKLSAEIKMSCQAKTKNLSVSANAGLLFNIF